MHCAPAAYAHRETLLHYAPIKTATLVRPSKQCHEIKPINGPTLTCSALPPTSLPPSQGSSVQLISCLQGPSPPNTRSDGGAEEQCLHGGQAKQGVVAQAPESGLPKIETTVEGAAGQRLTARAAQLGGGHSTAGTA